MIKPEQIPDEVVEAVARAMWQVECDLWRERHPRSVLTKMLPTFDDLIPQRQDDLRQQARAIAAAALNAWPGAGTDDPFTYDGKIVSPARLILPLPTDKSDD